MDGGVGVVTIINTVRKRVTDCGGENGVINGNKESVPDIQQILGDLPLGVSPWLGWREEHEHCSESDSQ